MTQRSASCSCGRLQAHTRADLCPDCGATVWYTPEGLEAFVAIPVGAFADPAFPAPTVSVYEERKHAWVAIPGDDVTHID